MNVKELKKLLEELPEDTVVIYSGRYDDSILEGKDVRFEPNSHPEDPDMNMGRGNYLYLGFGGNAW